MTLTDGRSPRRHESAPSARPVHEQLRVRARRTPDRPALTDGVRALGYAALDRRLDAIAALLHRHGVVPGDRIVLHTERSLDAIVVLLGIHRAGAAYVPVDPDLPAARAAMLVEDAAPALVLTDRPMPVAHACTSLAIDVVLAAPDASSPVRRGTLDDPAHVIFTSGSTGRPKGVAVGQRALAAFVDAVNEHYDIRCEDRVLQFSSLSFDGSVQEIFVPLAHGATVVVPPRPLLGAVGWVVDELARLDITWMAMPTSAWHALAADLDASGLALPERLRSVMVGGEAARTDAVLRWQAGVGRGRRLLNSYGPTEVTVASVVTELAPGTVRAGEAVPIGVPLAGVRALVVDDDGRPVRDGEIGELLLGGSQLADGYLGRADLTAARFVPDPTGGPGVVYCTGDRVRTRDDGLLVFEGRVDDQVKIRGYRIELAEIDAAFASHPGVVEAVTVVDRSRDDARLVTFAVTAGTDVETLRAHVALVLPPYAVPPVIERVASIPRTTGHKPDRVALRDRLAVACGPPPQPPGDRTPAGAAAVRGCFSEVLGRRVGDDDDFFALGGHSLLAVRLCSALERALGARVDLATVFDAPTPRALTAHLARAGGGSSGAGAVAPVVHERPTRLWLDRAPASCAQRRMWLLEARGASGDAYLLVDAHVVDGVLDVAALRVAARTTAGCHEVLRSRLVEGIGGGLDQVVDAVGQDVVEVLDHRDRGLDADACLAAAHDVVRRPFDLGRDHPWRIVVIAVAPEQHVLAIVVHHVATDGVSQQLLHRDLTVAYLAATTGAPAPAPPALQYVDHAVWQHAARARGAFAASLARVTAALTPVPEPVRVPSTRRRVADATGPGGLVVRPLDDALLAAVDRLATTSRTTRVAVLLTAYRILLHRLTDRAELVVGVPVTERVSDVYDATMGFFVNTAALRSVLPDDTDAAAAVHATHRALHAAVRDADVPFDLVVDALDVVAEPGQAPLVQTMFSLQSGDRPFTLDGLAVRPRPEARPAWAKFDLSLVVHFDETPRLVFEHRVDVVDASVVATWADRYVELLAALVGDPGVRVWDVPMLDPAERVRLAAEAARARTPFPADATVHDLVGHVAATRGDEVAVVDGTVVRTYGALLADSADLAERLRAAGAGPGGRVALELPRSYELVVAMLAVLRCGAAYVPIDPANPERRRALVRDLAGAVATVVRDDAALVVRPTGRATPDPGATGALAPAYVMFTSGSTGTPKGVVVPHRAIVRLVRDTDYVDLGPETVMAHLSNTSFDAATFEIWGALCNGGRLVVLDADTATSPRALGSAVRTHAITTMFLTTALFNVVAREEPDALRSVRDLLFGGEEADVGAVRRVLAQGAPARLVNAYGPTESTTFAAWHLVTAVAEDATRVPIGVPLANTTLHVVDHRGTPVPALVEGELWIGGDGLALGYAGDDALTARRFRPDPFATVPGARVYRTGDLVRRLVDGTIEFVGRLDDQVKVRGFRVEPGEIEAALRAIDGVALAQLLVRRDDDGVASLHAFVVPVAGHALVADDLRAALVAQLPGPLVPETVRVLEELPTNANGKVDREALERLVQDARGRTGEVRPAEAVTDPIVRRLISLWCDVLGETAVGPDDDFFRLGGTSIRAVRVVAALEREIGVRIGLSALFLAPTPRTLAVHVRTALDAPEMARTASSPDDALVVPMRPHPGHAEVVMCCLHPAGGQLYAYAPLTRLMPPSVEVLGVREVGWGAARPVHRTIEEYAARYAREIDAARPDATFVLAGYSLGGLLAYETARCLEARGRSVALVVLLDAVVVDAPTLTTLPSWVWNRRVLGWRARRRDAVERRRTTRDGRPPDRLLLGRESEQRGFRLQERYRPGPYDGRVLCVRAIGVGPTPDPDTFTHRWARVASTLEIVEVPGEHTGDESLLTTRHVPGVAAAILAALERGR